MKPSVRAGPGRVDWTLVLRLAADASGGRRRRIACPGAPVGPHADVPAVHTLYPPGAPAAARIEQIDDVTRAWLRDRGSPVEAGGDADATLVVHELEVDPQYHLAGRRIRDRARCAHIRALPIRGTRQPRPARGLVLASAFGARLRAAARPRDPQGAPDARWSLLAR